MKFVRNRLTSTVDRKTFRCQVISASQTSFGSVMTTSLAGVFTIIAHTRTNFNLTFYCGMSVISALKLGLCPTARCSEVTAKSAQDARIQAVTDEHPPGVPRQAEPARIPYVTTQKLTSYLPRSSEFSEYQKSLPRPTAQCSCVTD